MSYPLGPVQSQDNYVATTQIETQECARINFIISGAPIYYELYVDGNWNNEKYLPAAAGQTFFFSFDRKFTGVRFRSAVAGSPATVVIEAVPQGELPNA